MSAGRGFTYALEPIFLRRQWDLDALRSELGKCNAALARCAEQITDMQAHIDSARADLAALSGTGHALPVQRFALLARYSADMARQVREQQQAASVLNEERSTLIAAMSTAQRALEAVEQHRDEMEGQFLQLRLSADFKTADDQWNTLQAGNARDGS